MADLFKGLYQGYLPTAVGAALYTAPNSAGASAIAKPLTLVNMATVPVTFTLYKGGAAVTNTIRTMTLQPGDNFIDPAGFILGQNQSFYGVASLANSIVCTVDGDEIT